MRRSALRVATLEEVAHYGFGKPLPKGLIPPMAGGAGVPPAEYAVTVVSDSPLSYWRKPFINAGAAAPTFYDQMNVATLTGFNPSTSYSRAPGALNNDPLGATAGWSGAGTSSDAHNTSPDARLKVTGAFTIECWFKPITTGANTTYIYASQPGPVHFMYQGNATIVFGVNGGAAFVQSGNILTVSQWSHLVGVYDGTNLTLYQNGVVVAGPTVGQAPTGGSVTNISIGGLYAATPTNALNGASISDPTFYGKALTSTQVKDHYQKGISGQVSDYVALVTDDGGGPGSQQLWYWRFGELAGTVNSITVDRMARNYVSNPPGSTPGSAGALANDPDLSVTFTGSSYWEDYAVVDNPVMTNGPWSVEFWFKSTVVSASRQYLVVRDNGGTSTTENVAWYVIMEGTTPIAVGANAKCLLAGTQTAAGVYTGPPASAKVVMGDGLWHHVGFTLSADSKTSTLYLDGALDKQLVSTTSQAPYVTNRIIIAGSGSGGFKYFTGSIDELAIYGNVELSPAQVAAHYAAGIGRRFSQSGARQVPIGGSVR